MNIRKGSISHFILAFLLSARNTKTFHRLINSDELCQFDDKSVRVSMFRLKRKRFVENTISGWKITEKGKKETQNFFLVSPFEKKALKNTIVAFDIHEYDRKVRSWIRGQLRIFGYEMLQQSLWFGPGPLPRDFIFRLTDLGVKKDVKIFTLKAKKEN